MATRIQLRRDTAANWTSANPVLAIAEPGFETDTKKRKIGDGATAWNSLAYEASAAPDLTGYSTGEADYVVSRVVNTYYARPRDSTKPTYSGSDFSAVMQSAINNLCPAGSASGANGGRIKIRGNAYYFIGANEITITGWESNHSTAYSQLIIEGDGYSTQIIANTAGQNGFVIKNGASVVLRDFRMYVGASSKSGILADKNGADTEASMFKSIFDNIDILSASTGYPAMYLKNFFSLTAPNLNINSTANHGLMLENNSTVDDGTGRGATNYGNSHFGRLSVGAGGGVSGGFAGLYVKATAGGMGLSTIDHLECVNDCTYGLWSQGFVQSTINFVDLEGVKYPVYLDSGAGSETRELVINSGYLLPKDSAGGAAITSTVATGDNSIKAFLEVSATMVPINDLSNFRPTNTYDVSIRTAAAANLISITQLANTPLRVRKPDGSVTVSGPGTGGAVYVTSYTTAGSFTWTKPAGVSTVQVTLIGGGGGGGSGRRQVSGTIAGGGGGGGGAGMSSNTYPAAALGSTVSVTCGAGGAGGAAQTTDSTNGSSGTAGGFSIFGNMLSASGGNAGGGGSTTGGTGAGGSSSAMFAGATAGAGGAGGAGAQPGSTPFGAAGGGGGGGISTTPAAFNGGIGGAQQMYFTGASAAGGVAPGGTGTTGNGNAGAPVPGCGAGGGASSITGAGGTGGAGGTYGGGGGGGGASLNGFASGAGGQGGVGCVIVTAW